MGFNSGFKGLIRGWVMADPVWTLCRREKSL